MLLGVENNDWIRTERITINMLLEWRIMSGSELRGYY